MILASHVIFGAYGFWLPNDPRGSWSEFVGSWELFRCGAATKTESRRSVAAQPHDHDRRLAAKQALQRPAVHFTGVQAQAVGWSIAESARKGNVTVWANSILPEHVHLVLARHHYDVEMLVNYFKGAATRALVAHQRHPFGDRLTDDGRVPICWARGEWKVFLNTEADVRRAIRYVEENPLKEGKPHQRWPFVQPFV